MNFNLSLARNFAAESALAYEPHAGAAAVAVADAGTDTRAVLTWFHDCTVLAFRGTVDLENWLLNLDARQKPLAGGIKVHAGFLTAADALLPRLLAELLPAGRSKASLKPIYVTGHSLGGALASLIAFVLAREGFPIAGVYTYASPRVGNHAWQTAYQAALGDKTFRVVASGDLVPLLPGLLAGYRHVGQEVYLTDQILLNPSRLIEIAADSARTFFALERLDYKFILQFHSLEANYLKLLNRRNNY